MGSATLPACGSYAAIMKYLVLIAATLGLAYGMHSNGKMTKKPKNYGNRCGKGSKCADKMTNIYVPYGRRNGHFGSDKCGKEDNWQFCHIEKGIGHLKLETYVGHHMYYFERETYIMNMPCNTWKKCKITWTQCDMPSMVGMIMDYNADCGENLPGYMEMMNKMHG